MSFIWLLNYAVWIWLKFLEAAGSIGLEDNPMNGAWRTPLLLCAVAVMRSPALPLPQSQRYDAAVYEPNQD